MENAMRVGLDRQLEQVLGKGPAAKLRRAFSMETVGDLLWHLPRRYAKRGELTPLDALRVGEHVTVVAEVLEVTGRDTAQRTKYGKPGRLTRVLIHDGTGRLELTFFNQRWIEDRIEVGSTGVFSGTIGEYREQRQLAHPDFELFEDRDIDPERWANEPVPIYPATSTLPSATIQKLVGVALDGLADVEDPIPLDVRERNGLVPLHRAFELAHRPATDKDAHVALHTLRWQEAFVVEGYLLSERAWFRSLASTPRLPGELLARFDAALPFERTRDQLTVGEEIEHDIAGTVPMHRLVQGEVGSGKTLVALRAMLQIAESGGQSAMLAPTEVLASQHLRSIVEALGPELTAELHPVLLTGQQSQRERSRALLAIAAGQARIVVGTHALLGDRVSFDDLGLVVIDEQHRFGVQQREALRSKGMSPHTLVLTATPIPRTVAITAFGALDVSTIRTMPAGRSPISTFVVPQDEQPGLFQRIWFRMAEELQQGRQAFVVCPAIDHRQLESSADIVEDDERPAAIQHPLADVHSTLARLTASPALHGRRIAPLTGAMSSEEKAATMGAFAAAEIDVLVATTVIEVGVNVPNATTMVVLDADRFGVSQLHQLRGRVGRGTAPGICLLVTHAEAESPARERVEAVASTLDGFELAEIDLEQRREGDVLGTKQSGAGSGLRALRIARDGGIIDAARSEVEAILAVDEKLFTHGPLRRAVTARLSGDARAFLAAG